MPAPTCVLQKLFALDKWQALNTLIDNEQLLSSYNSGSLSYAAYSCH
jgi:hypothetical protein